MLGWIYNKSQKTNIQTIQEETLQEPILFMYFLIKKEEIVAHLISSLVKEETLNPTITERQNLRD